MYTNLPCMLPGELLVLEIHGQIYLFATAKQGGCQCSQCSKMCHYPSAPCLAVVPVPPPVLVSDSDLFVHSVELKNVLSHVTMTVC